jgi:Kef-type K+ transport system membrane component KefB/nucleotide-binding universal stress UspA family protein
MHGDDLILILLTQVVLILGLSRVVGMIFRYFRQPQVVGEMVAGIALGPSLLGWIAPHVFATIFRPDTLAGSTLHADPTEYLNVLSQVGVIFFLFLVGLELDPKLLKNRGHTAVVVSHVSIVAPFLLGAALALYLYPNLFTNSPHMRFTSVALFMGASMSITAFPVLARILNERNLVKTDVGAMAITCAAVDDVTAWCMLAFVVGIAKASGVWPGIQTALLAIVYVLVMFFVVRPFLRRIQVVYDRQGKLNQGVVGLVFVLVLASAWTTEAIGIHALFGAFLLGAVMPKGTRLVRTIMEKVEDFTVIFLLPIFFAFTGLRTQIGLIDRPELWVDTLLIVLVACLGKWGGSTVAGRACGMGWREASVIGVLMNTRGLMELVILNIGLQEGVITPAVFAMMVIMALATTALTTPVLHLIYPARLFGAIESEAKAKKATAGFSVLAPVSNPVSGVSLARLAGMLIGNASSSPAGGAKGKLFALHLKRPTELEILTPDLRDPAPEDDPALAPLLDEAKALSIPTEPISFMTRDVAADIAAVAAGTSARLVVMGFHKPVIGATILGGTVNRVFRLCPADVAIFVDRGFSERPEDAGPLRVLVPYMGSEHDRLAMRLAERMGRNAKAAVTVLHVVAAQLGSEPPLHARTAVNKIFADPTQPTPVELRVVHDPSPASAVIQASDQFDLVLIGVADEWGLRSHRFGWRPERIAQACPKSLLIVRRAPVRSQGDSVNPQDSN